MNLGTAFEWTGIVENPDAGRDSNGFRSMPGEFSLQSFGVGQWIRTPDFLGNATVTSQGRDVVCACLSCISGSCLSRAGSSLLVSSFLLSF